MNIKKLLYAENTVKIVEKKYQVYKGAQEPPLVFGQALVKTLKASSAQVSQQRATFECILRCSTWSSRAKVFFLVLSLMPILLGTSPPALLG